MRWIVKRVHAWISGRVQGVFYRAFTCEKARSLGLSGWVRNLPDGRVELVAEGPDEKVKALLQWCKQGPPAARVDHIKVVDEVATGEFPDFSVSY